MSLINDALKRAKQAQQQTSPTAPELPFRPVDPSQQPARRRRGLLLPVLLAVMTLVLLCTGWLWLQQRRADAAIEAAARSTDVSAKVLQLVETKPIATPEAATPLSSPQPVTSVATDAPPAQAISQPTNAPVAALQTAPATNAAPVVAPEPPKPAPLRLQAILFDPSRPSAIISGKTVYVGDRVRDLKVAAIGKDSTTLVSSSQTNILSLAH